MFQGMQNGRVDVGLDVQIVSQVTGYLPDQRFPPFPVADDE